MTCYHIISNSYNSYRDFVSINAKLRVWNTQWVVGVNDIRGLHHERLILVGEWWLLGEIHAILDDAFIRKCTFITKDGKRGHKQLKDILLDKKLGY